MGSVYYTEPSAAGVPAYLALGGEAEPERRFPFFSHLEIGRYHPSRQHTPGLLLLDDPTVSRRHCFVTRSEDGRCRVRDVSTNGTRLDGRRLVPNLEFEVQPGQTISVGSGHDFVLVSQALQDLSPADAAGAGYTVGIPGNTIATVLVGDIQNYTGMVRTAMSPRVISSSGPR